MLGCRSSEPQRQGSSMKTWLLGLTAVCASSAAMAAQPQMSVDARYDWYGWGSVSEHWVIRRDAYGLTTRVQVVERPDGKARLPELLPFGAMAALDTALQTAPLTRAAAVQRIASRLDRAEILSLDPGLHSLDTDACSFAQQRAWARKALSVLSQAGVRLVLSGHLHRTYTSQYENIVAEGGGLQIVSAGSATSVRLRNEVNTYNRITIAPGGIDCEPRAWNGQGWERLELNRATEITA